MHRDDAFTMTRRNVPAPRGDASWQRALGAQFADDLLTLLTTDAPVVRLAADRVILRTGDRSSTVYLLTRGAMRMVYLRRGREHIGDFFLEGDLVADYTSFVTGRPTRFDIVATEACELLAITPVALARGHVAHPLAMERGLRLVAQQQALNFSERIWSGLMDTPAERYHALLAERPTWFARFPLYMIASYLGMTPEGLSKLRRRVAT
jgi:CRP-like cAMP-binding protein